MKLIKAILLFMLPALLHASPELFESGNTAYREGNYTLAIENYQAILETVNDGKVHYNLGNAYYKTGDFARAILHFEKALKQFPNDKDIKHNLDIANLQTIDKINPTPEFFLLTAWKDLATKFKANTWTILFLVILWLAILLFLIFSLSGSRFKKLIFLSGLTSVTISLLLLLMAITQHRYETSKNQAIIIAPSASVKSEPLNSGTDLFIIHEGLKIKVIDEEGNWIRICLPDGKEGWLPGEMAEAI